MEKRGVLTKILAIIGAVLVWLPILAPFIFSIGSLMGDGIFRFDYLIPAELFPLILIGGGLLFWASRRVHSQQKLIGWSLLLTAGFLVGCQTTAVITGLASGEIEPAGLPLIAVTGMLILYILGVVGIGVGGIFLLRDLFLPSRKS